MKPLIVNTYDFGGAANACIRLHNGLLAEGVDSKVLLRQKTNNEIQQLHAYAKPPTSKSGLQKLKDKAHRILKELHLAPQQSTNEEEEIRRRNFIKNRPEGLDLFTYPAIGYDITTQELYKQADVINLHWVADFVDLKAFFEKNTKPVVWTLHDEAPFLGGEHYAERYLGTDTSGKPMVRKYTKAEIEEQTKIIAYKQGVFSRVNNLHIVTPSLWLYNRSLKSELFDKFPHYHIPNGFPTHIFKLHNKAFAREVLGIPQHKTVLLFVADTITNQRKGYAYLQQAITGLSHKEKEAATICTVGNKQGSIDIGGGTLIEFGKIIDERLMALIYSAADAFIIPSLEDNLPNTMIEAMLCGTPVIGFPTGGIAETIENGVNGYLCEEISVKALHSTIQKFMLAPDIFDQEKIAAAAKEQYSLCKQANSYIQLYSQIAKHN